ncbi:CLUMA_CG015620, isoform A [Clunio marinus]|uniref:CLUMA_CG015620, isoform A n=1 Tax=Clunio marinus TaxID=568069 RepID=A0A1J1ITV8_9DIPT|nr:CLUMA_CG015620, isoform A [Clunio marinus]
MCTTNLHNKIAYISAQGLFPQHFPGNVTVYIRIIFLASTSHDFAQKSLFLFYFLLSSPFIFTFMPLSFIALSLKILMVFTIKINKNENHLRMTEGQESFFVQSQSQTKRIIFVIKISTR